MSPVSSFAACGTRRSTRDGGPLSRAEWLKFVALFFNKEELANRLFDQIVRNYEQSVLSGTKAVEGENMCGIPGRPINPTA